MIKARCFDAFRTSDALSIYSLALSPFACPMASASPIAFAAAVVDDAPGGVGAEVEVCLCLYVDVDVDVDNKTCCRCRGMWM